MKKRVISLFLILALSVTMLAACGSSNAGQTTDSNNSDNASSTETTTTQPAGGDGAEGKVTEPGTFPIVDGPMTLKVAAQNTKFVGDLASNRFAQWYEEKTGVHIEWVELPEDPNQMVESVNLMLVSGDLPDIFMNTVVEPDLNGSRGTYLALNDLIDKYGVETKKIFEAKSDILPGSITATDGNIYALPDINDAYHSAHNIRAWINQSWLDKLGLSYPQTTEDFENVLRAFKTGDPNGNGVADEIPMNGAATGWNDKVYPFLLNSFVPFYEWDGLQLPYTYIKDGKVEFVANTDDFHDGLRWIKKLVDEGLIDKLALTQTEEQLQMVGYAPDTTYNGVVTSSLWALVMPMGDVEDPAATEDFNNRSHNYVGLSPLEGPKGVRISPLTATGVGSGTNMAVITSSCRNPEVAMRWLDGLYNEEVTLYSQMGMDYGTPPEGATGINGKPALFVPQFFTTAEEAAASKSWMVNVAIANRTDDIRLGEMADYSDPATKWGMEVRLYNETKDHFAPYAQDELATPYLAFTEDENSERVACGQQINDYVKEQIVLFITGSRDLEKEWASYVKEFDALKLDTYMGLLQTAYDRQYK